MRNSTFRNNNQQVSLVLCCSHCWLCEQQQHWNKSSERVLQSRSTHSGSFVKRALCSALISSSLSPLPCYCFFLKSSDKFLNLDSAQIYFTGGGGVVEIDASRKKCILVVPPPFFFQEMQFTYKYVRPFLRLQLSRDRYVMWIKTELFLWVLQFMSGCTSCGNLETAVKINKIGCTCIYLFLYTFKIQMEGRNIWNSGMSKRLFFSFLHNVLSTFQVKKNYSKHSLECM